ncbi:unnamed protein product [Ceratitis capitata]|uniref:(Mediterranean fruit fly) hypothetical protein n=1 Tax=Ceratitis capitata TaxID=7213 RepID=A0A811V2Y4_CERCA|nr:unnamed protein product [Ceratitis capitata]
MPFTRRPINRNCKFFAGNADDYIQSMVREVVYGNAPGAPLDLIAVVDPLERGSPQYALLQQLNACLHFLQSVHAQRNWIELGRPESKHIKEIHLSPKTAIAVDMFPHTTHTELVILFERFEHSDGKEETWKVKCEINADIEEKGSKESDIKKPDTVEKSELTLFTYPCKCIHDVV